MAAGIAWIAPLFYSVKRQEEALQKSELKIRLITENMRDTVFIYDMNRQLQYVNPAFETLTGYTTKELYEKNFINYIHPEDEKRIIKLWDELFQGHAFAGKDFRIITKDGQIKWCLSSWSPLFDEKGNQIGVQGREADITEGKRSEEAILKSQQMLEKTFASLREAVFIIDANTVKIIDCNPSATKIFGYSRDEMLERTTTFLHVDESALEEFRRRLYHAVEEKGFLFLTEFRMKRKDGTVFHTEHHVSSLEDERGNRIGWVSVVRDITEQKHAEEALRRSEESAKRLAQENAIVAEIGRIISSTLNIEEVYEHFAEEVNKLIPSEGIAINIINHKEGTLTIPYVSGIAVPGRQPGATFPLEGSVAEEVVHTHSGLIVQMEDKNELQARFPTLL